MSFMWILLGGYWNFQFMFFSIIFSMGQCKKELGAEWWALLWPDAPLVFKQWSWFWACCDCSPLGFILFGIFILVSRTVQAVPFTRSSHICMYSIFSCFSSWWQKSTGMGGGGGRIFFSLSHAGAARLWKTESKTSCYLQSIFSQTCQLAEIGGVFLIVFFFLSRNTKWIICSSPYPLPRQG